MEIPIDRIEGDSRAATVDHVAVEEPLEIRLCGESIAVVMRSPGHDEELAVGFLYTERIVRSAEEVRSVTKRRDPKNPELANVVDVETAEGVDAKQRGWQRNFVSASSCGLCGKLTIEAVRLQVPSVRSDPFRISKRVLETLPDKMRAEQGGFDETGGIHAAGLFDASGRLRYVREDIGRHNAVDKIVGAALMNDELPLDASVLMVSGRASFEIVQKALMARIPMVAAVSAASSLAVDLASSCGMGMVGFLRDRALNVYSGVERIGP